MQNDDVSPAIKQDVDLFRFEELLEVFINKGALFHHNSNFMLLHDFLNCCFNES